MVDVKKLEAEIDALGITKSKLAEKCGFSRQTFANKLENPQTITADDAYKIAAALRIDDHQFMQIFFASDVEGNSNNGSEL